MKKLTEKNKVENYLKSFMEIEDFTVEDLMDITVFDMLGNSDLEGISKTTLSEALDSFKQKIKLKKSVEEDLIPAEQTEEEGLTPAKHTKEERVTRFLTKLMKEPDFKVDNLTNLTVLNLLGNPELEGIGKTTLTVSVSAFKKKYLKIQDSSESISEQPNFKTSNSDDSKDFNSDQGNEVTTDLEVDKLENHESQTLIEKEETEETSFENVGKNVNEIVVKRKPATQQKVRDTSLNAFTSDEMANLKKMIDQFKAGKMNTVSPMQLELIVLKHALQHFGFNYKTIMEQYRKIVE